MNIDMKLILVIFLSNVLQFNSICGKESLLKYEVTEVVDEGDGHKYEVYEKVEENQSNNVQVNDDSIKWMILPNSRGDIDLAILSGLTPRSDVQIEEVDFYLYSRQNPTRAEKRSMNSSCLPVFKYFKPGRPTKFLIHGFGDSIQESIMYPLLRDEVVLRQEKLPVMFEKGTFLSGTDVEGVRKLLHISIVSKAFISRGDYNIFMVDWNKLAATPWYNYASANTIKVGRHSAALLDHLSNSAGLDVSMVHLIGFSLGAHVAGLIGQNVKKGRIKRITALDPAQVLYSAKDKNERLDPGDADLVEVIHTSGGYLGFQDPLGHRDVFPNGGFWPQPGCVIDYAGVCSHRRAYYYYGESVKYKKGFRAVHCNSWPEYLAGVCDKNLEDSFELANDNKNKRIKGNFFLKTNEASPFGVVEKKVKESSDEYDYVDFFD